jgi:pyruvate formate lyase activating enzyme
MTNQTKKSLTGTIFKIKKYALHDGPGIRTTIFFKGCPLKCWWCHNPEGLRICPEMMDPLPGKKAPKQTIGKVVSIEEVVTEIEKDTIFYDESGGGVTFSGGEPLMQSAFLDALIEACHNLDIHTTLDTTGYAPSEVFHPVASKSDLVLYDLKIMDDARHLKFTGVSNALILKNLESIAGNGKEIQIRFPLIPGGTDDIDNVRQVARFVKSLGTIQQVDVLPYHRTAESKYQRLGMSNRMQQVAPLTDEQVHTIKQELETHGLHVSIGG